MEVSEVLKLTLLTLDESSSFRKDHLLLLATTGRNVDETNYFYWVTLSKVFFLDAQ